VRFWNELYGRTDEEMNGRLFVSQGQNVEFTGPVDSVEDDPVLQAITPDLFQGSPSKTSPLTQSLKVGMTPSRSASPAIGPGNRELSSSLPDLTHRPSTRNTNSAPSTPLALSRMPTSTSTPTNSPIWTRARPPVDLLSGGGVKSVWGKLSSNASAAFSAVQDAYTGVAKDLRNTGQEDDMAERTSELRGRETLSAWGQERSPPTSPRVVPVVMSNPWATSNTYSQPDTTFDDNPWGSSYDEPSTKTRHEANQSIGPLPLDPTVTIPTPLRKTTGSSSSSASRGPRLGRGSQSTPKPSSPVKSNTDPLGVGLL